MPEDYDFETESQLDPEALVDGYEDLRLAPLMLTYDDAARAEVVAAGHEGVGAGRPAGAGHPPHLGWHIGLVGRAGQGLPGGCRRRENG